MTAVKIRYERRTGKGAGTFIGMVCMDDGSKVPVDGYTGSEDLTALPVEHEIDGTAAAPSIPAMTFPKIKP